MRAGIARLVGRFRARALPRFEVFETELGRLHLLPNDALARHLITGDLHEPHFHRLAQLLLSGTDHVLDLGANFGSHSLRMARIAHHVTSFEPLGLTFSQLQLNLALNGLHNVTAYKMAVSDRTGDVIRMQPVDYAAANVNVGNTRVSRRAGGDAALSVRLDDLGLQPVSFIKMDIQGSETAALCGAEALLARDRPVIFVEVEEKHLRACGSSSKELMEHLLARDYCLFRVLTDYPCDHVAVPAERLAELEPRLDGIGFPLQKIAGRRVELRFDEGGYTYSDIEVH
jgi:FkbM family methyltransferase